MRSLTIQIQMNCKRMLLRNPAFVMFSLLLPTSFYWLFTKIMVAPNGSAAEIQSWNLNYLVSMCVYSILISAIFTVTNTVIGDRKQNIDTMLRVTPFSMVNYYLSVLAVMSLLNLVALIVIVLAGTGINQIQLPIGRWALFLVVGDLLSLPLLLVGLLVAQCHEETTANILTNLFVFPMAMVSGLWWPIKILPQWLQNIGKMLPVYHITELLKAILHQNAIPWVSMINVLSWTGGLMILLLIVMTSQKNRSFHE